MKSLTRRSFLKLCALALPALTVLSRTPIPVKFKPKKLIMPGSHPADLWPGVKLWFAQHYDDHIIVPYK